MSTPLKAFEQDYYRIRDLGEGQTAHVFLCLSKAKVATILGGQTPPEPTAKVLDALRAECQALKIAPSQAGVLTQEIRIIEDLTKYNPFRHITTVTSKADPLSRSEGIPWYTSPMYGSTLSEVIKTQWRPDASQPPAAFAWHICLQVISMFLFLGNHIDDGDDQNAQMWPKRVHGDFHGGNILFRLDPPTFGDYPDLVLVDFGNANMFTKRKAEEFTTLQARDLQNVLSLCLLVLADRTLGAGDDGFEGKILMAELQLLWSTALDVTNSCAVTLERMRKFVNIAKGKRQELYRPLGNSISMFLASFNASDEELERKFFGSY